MPIYVDISAAVHHRAGLGRYAESLVNALVPLLPGELNFFYNRERGIEHLDNLAYVPSHTVSLGYKPWRMLVWGGAAGKNFDEPVCTQRKALSRNGTSFDAFARSPHHTDHPRFDFSENAGAS